MFKHPARGGAIVLALAILLVATAVVPVTARGAHRTRTQIARGWFMTAEYGIGDIDHSGLEDVERDGGRLFVRVRASGRAEGTLTSRIYLGMDGVAPTLTGTIVGDAVCGGIFDRKSGWALFVIRDYGPYVPVHYLLFAYHKHDTWGGRIWYGDQTYDCSDPAVYADFAAQAPAVLTERRSLVSGDLRVRYARS